MHVTIYHDVIRNWGWYLHCSTSRNSTLLLTFVTFIVLVTLLGETRLQIMELIHNLWNTDPLSVSIPLFGTLFHNPRLGCCSTNFGTLSLFMELLHFVSVYLDTADEPKSVYSINFDIWMCDNPVWNWRSSVEPLNLKISLSNPLNNVVIIRFRFRPFSYSVTWTYIVYRGQYLYILLHILV